MDAKRGSAVVALGGKTRARARRTVPEPSMPSIGLAQVVALGSERSVTLRIQGALCPATVEPHVDWALIEEAAAQGARVVVERGQTWLVVGLLTTQRALTIDANNRVRAKLASLTLDVEEQALLRTPQSFLQLTALGDVELFGQRIVSRARKLAKILAAHISLN